MRTENEPTGRPARSFIEEARRAQIIAAATETVAELGYTQASLARIAARAQVSKSVISYHFDGKDELLLEVVTRYLDAAWASMEERLDAQTTARGRIGAWVGAQLAYFGADRAGFLAMVEIVTNHRTPDGTLLYADGEREEIEALAEILRQGQHDGELRDVDADAVAVIVKQCIEGALGQWAMDETIDLEAQTGVLVDFIDHALRREPAP